jgi:hypothetical protein
MKTKSLIVLFALLCGAFSLAGCGAPADGAVKEFIGVTDKHTAKVEEGSWDKAAFEADMKPVLEKMKELRKSNPDLPITKGVNDDFEASTKKFQAACTSKGNSEAQLAMAAALFDMAGTND